MEEGGQKRETSQERRKGRIEGESISVFLWGVTESQAARWMPVGVLSDWQSSWLFTLFFFFSLDSPGRSIDTRRWHSTGTHKRNRAFTLGLSHAHTQTCLKFTVSPANRKAVYNGINMEMEVNASVAFSEQWSLWSGALSVKPGWIGSGGCDSVDWMVRLRETGWWRSWMLSRSCLRAKSQYPSPWH